MRNICVVLAVTALLTAQGTITVTTPKESATLPWQDDTAFAVILKGLSDRGGGTIAFSAGTFRFDRGVNIQGIKGITFTGVPGATIWKLRSLDEWGKIKTTAATKVSDKRLVVDHPELMKVGYRYQAFFDDQRGGRLLEASVKAIDADGVALAFCNATHPNLTEVPAGAYIVPEINFLDGWALSDITVKGITMDGGIDPKSLQVAGKPFTTGHTTHCGLLFRAAYKDRKKKPMGRNIHVEDCVFQNLAGRGFVAYNTEGITVKKCRFENIRTENCEIDHWSELAVITDCTFKGGFTGVQLNDCNGVTVSNCTFEANNVGIFGLDALHDPLTNKNWKIINCTMQNVGKGITLDGNVQHVDIERCTFAFAGSPAVDIRGSKINLRNNVFRDCGKTPWGEPGDRATLEGNKVE